MGEVGVKGSASKGGVPVVVDLSPPLGLAGLAEALAAEVLFGELTRERVLEAARWRRPTSLPALDAVLLLHRLVVRDPLFLRVDPALAVEGQLRALPLFAPLGHASAWLGAGADLASPVCLGAAGVTEPRRPIRSAAARALEGKPTTNGGDGASPIRAVPVRVESGRCVLVVLTRRGKTRSGLAHAVETATALASILERQRLLDRALSSTTQLLAAVDRRVTRLGFDIHDGPLQRLSLLAGELALLNRQLGLLVSDEASRAVAERRIADLTGLASDVAGELRVMARLASDRGTEPLVSQLERAARDLELRAGIPVELDVEGDVDRVTESQRIAVARVVEEALTNVADHSRATRVRIAVRRDADLLLVTVADDGCGFDVARSRKTAERMGRLGLSSMHERVRMLGGRLEIASRRGGPTVVTAELPAWDPLERSSRQVS